MNENAQDYTPGNCVWSKKPGEAKKRWEDSIKDWTGFNSATSHRGAVDQIKW